MYIHVWHLKSIYFDIQMHVVFFFEQISLILEYICILMITNVQNSIYKIYQAIASWSKKREEKARSEWNESSVHQSAWRGSR